MSTTVMDHLYGTYLNEARTPNASIMYLSSGGGLAHTKGDNTPERQTCWEAG